eukprot:123022_1
MLAATSTELVDAPAPATEKQQQLKHINNDAEATSSSELPAQTSPEHQDEPESNNNAPEGPTTEEFPGENGNSSESGAVGASSPTSQESGESADQKVIQMSIPADAAGCVIGRGGCNIRQVTSASGAKVNVFDATSYSTQRTIQISGTIAQVEMATSHVEDLLKMYDPSKAPKSFTAQNYKTRLCRHFVGGKACPYGGRCHFAHGTHEIRPVPLDQSARMHTAARMGARHPRPDGAYGPSSRQNPAAAFFSPGAPGYPGYAAMNPAAMAPPPQGLPVSPNNPQSPTAADMMAYRAAAAYPPGAFDSAAMAAAYNTAYYQGLYYNNPAAYTTIMAQQQARGGPQAA